MLVQSCDRDLHGKFLINASLLSCELPRNRFAYRDLSVMHANYRNY